MKNLRTVFALAAGTILFMTGLAIPFHYLVWRDIFLITGTLLVLFFYVTTLIQVINSPLLSQSRRIFWLIVVICVPVMGNLAYVIIQDTLTRKQVPHGIW